MKNLKIISLYAFIILAIFGLNACQEKSSKEIVFTSADELIKITVNGKKPTQLDPWTVELAIQYKDRKKEPLMLEIFAENLNQETVKLDWQDNKNGKITFYQQDGTTRKLNVFASEEGVAMREE